MSQEYTKEASAGWHQEVEFLIETLQEYTKRLRDKSEEIRDDELKLVVSFGFSTAFTLVTYSVINKKIDFVLISAANGENLYVSAFAIIVSITIVASTYLILRKRTRDRSDIRRLSKIVTQLLRRSSQIGDRGSIPFAQKVILDVGLADAESALYRASRLDLFASRRLWDVVDQDIISADAKEVRSTKFMSDGK